MGEGELDQKGYFEGECDREGEMKANTTDDGERMSIDRNMKRDHVSDD